MASQQSTVDFIVEQAGGTVSARRMFGEYGVFRVGKMVAVICNDQLYLKPTAGGRAYLGTVTEAIPFPRAKPYCLIGGERWDEDGFLAELFTITAAELPAPRAKVLRRRGAQ